MVILLLLRTVAKVDSIGFVVLKCTQYARRDSHRRRAAGRGRRRSWRPPWETSRRRPLRTPSRRPARAPCLRRSRSRRAPSSPRDAPISAAGKNISGLMVRSAALLGGVREHLAQRPRTPAPRRRWPAPGRPYRGVWRRAADPPTTQSPRGSRHERPAPCARRRAPRSAPTGKFGLLEADVDVDPVGPQVHVIHAGQIPRTETRGPRSSRSR